MALHSGSKLGPYEIITPVGAGGMGEVYRAKDTRLDRTVAIKILPSHLSSNADLKARFEHEARAISSLSHPHICALYDIGQQDGTDYLVMEFLEGETLADRLEKGALPTEQLLRFGMQIADALSKAHRHGIIHRDLKPANIMLTKSGVKLLDFGLAKSQDIVKQKNTGVSALPTEMLTAEGTILGTIQYMSPEQLEGREVDSRTDIFALGGVLYEMTTGKKAFSGESPASLISSILRDEPSLLSQVQPLAPPVLDHVVKKCLAKDPDERWQSAYDVASELKWIADASSQSVTARPSKNRERFLMFFLAVLLLIAVGLGILYTRRPQETEAQLVRFTILPPMNSTFQGTIAVSPDGKKLAFVVANENGKTNLWVRHIDSTESQMLSDTEGALYPFWSPDSRLIGYFARGKLRKMDSSSGASEILSDAPDPRGGSWSKNGMILFVPRGLGGVFQVSSNGGTATSVSNLDVTLPVLSDRWPTFLPDGRHFLYVKTTGHQQSAGIYVGSVDSKESKRLLPIASRVVYIPSGYLLYVDQEELMCRPFDATRMEFRGEAFPVAHQPWVDYYIFGSSGFSASENGVLAYRGGGNQLAQFAWYDRAGKKLSTIGPPCKPNEPAFSPDETRVVFYQFDSIVGISDLWVLDLSSGQLSRFTFDPSDDNTAVWSPDGTHIVWSSCRSGQYELYMKLADGSGTDEPLLATRSTKFPDDWSPDGKYVLYSNHDPKTKTDLWLLPLAGDRKSFPYLQTPATEVFGHFHPNGKWITYVSDESGQREIYVQSFPTSKGGRWQISVSGGETPMWRKDGKELFYAAPDGTIMSVDIKSSDSSFASGTPSTLFKLPGQVLLGSGRSDYLVSADGQRFLIAAPVENTVSLPITVVLNWTKLIQKQK